MQEKLVDFQVAKLAKEKGFNWWCRYYYEVTEEPASIQNLNYKNEEPFKQPAIPTQALLQKWLREVHGIFVSVDVNFNVKIYYKDELHNEIFNFNSYEEALEKGLQEGLKLIEYENKTNTN